MSRAYDPAYPVPADQIDESYCGLTIREHFAAMAITSVTRELNEGSDSIEKISQELGIEPREYRSEIHWGRFIAKRIARRADDILAELAKPVQP